MVIYVDDQPTNSNATVIGDALNEVRAILARQKRIVVEVKLDGTPLRGENLDQHQSTLLTPASELRCFSANPHEVAYSALKELPGALDQAQHLFSHASDLISQDSNTEAMSHVSQGIEIWQQVQQAVIQSCDLVDINLNYLTVDDQKPTVIIDNLIDQLKNTRDAIQTGDVVGLADALGYEWPELTERWQQLIEALIALIDEQMQKH